MLKAMEAKRAKERIPFSCSLVTVLLGHKTGSGVKGLSQTPSVTRILYSD